MRAIRTQFSRVSYGGKKGGQHWMGTPAVLLPTGLGGCEAAPSVLRPPNWEGLQVICAAAPAAEAKELLGTCTPRMLLNDLSPASPKLVFFCLAKATAPGTEGMAKLRSKGETQQTPSSCRSPAHH